MYYQKEIEVNCITVVKTFVKVANEFNKQGSQNNNKYAEKNIINLWPLFWNFDVSERCFVEA